MKRRDPTEIAVSTIVGLAEGVSVLMFLGMLFLWLGIAADRI